MESSHDLIRKLSLCERRYRGTVTPQPLTRCSTDAATAPAGSSNSPSLKDESSVPLKKRGVALAAFVEQPKQQKHLYREEKEEETDEEKDEEQESDDDLRRRHRRRRHRRHHECLTSSSDSLLRETLCECHEECDHHLLVFSGVSLPSKKDVKALGRKTKLNLNVVNPISHSGISLSKLKMLLIDIIKGGNRNDSAWIAREIHAFTLLSHDDNFSSLNTTFTFQGQPLREMIHTLYFIIVTYADPTVVFSYNCTFSMLRRYCEDPRNNLLFLAKTIETLRRMSKLFGNTSLLQMFNHACKGDSRTYSRRLEAVLLNNERDIQTHTDKMVEAVRQGDSWEASFRLALIYRIIQGKDLKEVLVWMGDSYPDKPMCLNAEVDIAANVQFERNMRTVLFSELWEALEFVADKIDADRISPHMVRPLGNSIAVRKQIFFSVSNCLPVDRLACLLSCVLTLSSQAQVKVDPCCQTSDDKLKLVWKMCYDPSFVWHTGHTVHSLGYYGNNESKAVSFDKGHHEDALREWLEKERQAEIDQCHIYDPGHMELPPVDRPLCPDSLMVDAITYKRRFVNMFAKSLAYHSQPALEERNVATSLRDLSDGTVAVYEDWDKNMSDVLSVKGEPESQFGIDMLFYNSLCRRLNVPTFNGKFGLRIQHVNGSRNVAFEQDLGYSLRPWRGSNRADDGSGAAGESCAPFFSASVTAAMRADSGPRKTKLFALIVLQLIMGAGPELKPSDFKYSYVFGDFFVPWIKGIGNSTIKNIIESDSASFAELMKLCMPLPKNWINLLPRWCQGLFGKDGQPTFLAYDIATPEVTPKNSLRMKPSTYDSWKPENCYACLSANDGYVLRDDTEIRMSHRCVVDATHVCDSDSDHGFDCCDLNFPPVLRADRNNPVQASLVNEMLSKVYKKHAFEHCHRMKCDKNRIAAFSALTAMQSSRKRLDKVKKKIKAKSTTNEVRDSIIDTSITFGAQDLVGAILDVATETGFLDQRKLEVVISNVCAAAYSVFSYIECADEPATLDTSSF